MFALVGIGLALAGQPTQEMGPINLTRSLHAIAFVAPALCAGDDEIALQIWNLSGSGRTNVASADFGELALTIIATMPNGSIQADPGMTVEGHLSHNEDSVRCVSSRAKLAGATKFICLDNFPAALALFNDADRVIGARIVADLREGRSPLLKASVDGALERFVEEFDIEANGADYYEAEPEGATVDQWSVSPGAVNVVSADADTLTVVIKVEAEIEFHASFRFSHWDGIDREYIRLPSSSGSAVEQVALEIAITVYKDDLDDPEPNEVSVESSGLTVDFGYVEPDWG